MDSVLTIGDFSRATHMSVKTLRHYHRVGLLEPAAVDPGTGYRYYALEQIPTAQVIRRFRDLEMPLEDIRAVIAAPDVDARNARISAHLRRLEDGLARTQAAVASLNDLLGAPTAAPEIRHRSVPATPAASISEIVGADEISPWWQGALGELRASLRAQGLPSAGAGGVFSNELFAEDRGRATLFVPAAHPVAEVGRVTRTVIPAVELATIVHEGSPAEIDRSYGALAAYVAAHALGVEGPLREYYLVGPDETDDEDAWLTEIGWPIFQTGAP